MGFFNVFMKDMGIDLGTANTVVYVKDEGLVVKEPSVVALNEITGEVLAVGTEAKSMIGRTPGNIKAVRPLKDGVIADFDITQNMLRYFFDKAYPSRSFFVGPRVVIGIPSGVTEVEKRSVEEAAVQAGAKEAYLIEEPMAAAIGAGLPVEEPTGNMIVDIGGGTTEIAVISLGGIVNSKSIRIGGDEMDDTIVQYIRKNYNLMIGERTAEAVKIGIGCVYPMDEFGSMEIRGRDLLSGLPKMIEISANEILEALSEPAAVIIDAIKYTLEKSPPELAADIIEHGIVLAGGGAMLGGLDKLIISETGLNVTIAEDPLDCVALGTGKVIEHLESLKRVLLTTKKFR